MRIALLTPSFLPAVGGAQNVVHNLARVWAGCGHKVTVLNCTTDEVVAPDAEYSVRRLPLLRGSTRFGYHRFPFSSYAVHKLRHLLRNASPDVVSAHQAYPTSSWLARLSQAPPFFVTCHGGDIEKEPWADRARYGVERELRRSMQKAAAVVAISEHIRRLLLELNIPDGQIVNVPNGVDLERFRLPAKVDVRELLCIPRDALLILSVGRDHPTKALDDGLRAFLVVAEARSDVHYLLLGRGTDRLKKQAATLGISDRVTTHPTLAGDALVAAYQQSEIYFSCSVSEAFPLSMLEAMAAGLPLVATKVSGHEDAIEHEVNGLLVAPKSIEEMAWHLKRLVQDPNLRQRLGENARNAATIYDWKAIGDMYLELFERTGQFRAAGR